MSWRDQLRPASFRGVPFFVDSADGEVGRRLEIVRVAGTADVVPQELGPDARSFQVTAYVIGSDYMSQRERLEDALVAEGAGALVLPWRGELQAVVAGKVRIVESKTDGGMARFTIPFLETVLTLQPLVEADQRRRVLAAASAALASGAAAFAEGFDVSAMAPTSRITLATDLRAVLTRTVAACDPLGGVGADLATVATLAGGIEANLEGLLEAPSTLAEQVLSMVGAAFDGLAALVGTATRVVGAGVLGTSSSSVPSRDVVEATLRAVEGMQTTGAGQDAARIAFDVLVRVAAAASGASVLAALPFESYDQATAASRRMVDVLGGIDIVADDVTFAAVAELRAAVVDHMARVASTLPELRTWTTPSTLSTLLVAHLVYGDARREDEIVARNRTRISHPGLLPPGSSLEVLSA